MNGPIKVEKAGRLFFFFYDHVDDYDNLMALEFACLNEALLIFQSWVSGASIDCFGFEEAVL